mgnify:CR=1 FL=1
MAKKQPQRALVVTVPDKGEGVIHFVNVGGRWLHNGSTSAAKSSFFFGTSAAYFDSDGFWTDETLSQILGGRLCYCDSLSELASVNRMTVRELRPYIRRWEA